MASTSRGILKYSTDRASANEFGGTMQQSDWMVTNDRSSKCFGSTVAAFTLVKILNSSATRRSYPYDDSPYEITPSRTCFSLKGLIMSCSCAILRIQRSLFIAIPLLMRRSLAHFGRVLWRCGQKMDEYRILPPHERQHRAFAATTEHAHLLPPN